MKKLFCENCGSKIEDGAKFCAVCGFAFENDDEEAIEGFVDISPLSEVSLADTPDDEFPAKLTDRAPAEKAVYKKPSYMIEKILLVVSAVCALCSLGFYLFVTNFGGVPMENKASDSTTDIPVLTVDMAEEIINNSYWCFPYYFFEERGMLNKNDYIIHPTTRGSDYEVKCYSAEGIDSLEDYYKCFDEYATREFIETYYNRELFIIVENSKIYFAPNEWVGWYSATAEELIIEKIDDETYYVTTSFWTGEELILKYIDGKFKVTTITPEDAYASFNIGSDKITIPDISEMSIDKAEAELKKVGLNLDRNNITYVFNCLFEKDGMVFAAKDKYKKVTPGSAIGIYVAVENPEDYNGNGNNESVEQTNEITDDYVRNMLINASAVDLKWLGFRYCFTDEEDRIGPDDADKVHYVDRNDYITYDDNGYTIKAYAVVDDDIKSVADLRALYSKYFDKEYTERRCSGYIDRNGKLYVAVGDAGLWEPCAEYNDDISKVNDEYYIYTLTGDGGGELVTVYYDVILEDGKWVFTEKYEDTHGRVVYSGFMPVWGAENCIYD